jgi:hypothetical protein
MASCGDRVPFGQAAVMNDTPWHRPPLRSIPEAKLSGRAGVRHTICYEMLRIA